MYNIHARNVNGAFSKGMELIANASVMRESRNGLVLEMPSLVVTEYTHPHERVLFCDARHANPFFHFMEGIWMLAGSADLSFIARYNKHMEKMSEDGEYLTGSYGYRWIEHFGFNQIDAAVSLLKKDRDDRRVVISHWDAEFDFAPYYESKKAGTPVHPDIPCNTQIYFYIRDGKLTMTVCNRSNDMVWGAYGANAVHMSMLQEYVATAIDAPIGSYFQVSNSFHVYNNIWEDLFPLWNRKGCAIPARLRRKYPPHYDPYIVDDIQVTPMVSDVDSFLTECHDYVTSEISGEGGERIIYQNEVFPGVVIPMKKAWEHHKAREYELAIGECLQMNSEDWAVACINWLQRTEKQWISSTK